MDLTTALEQNRDAVLEEWYDAIIKTYPQQASRFLARSKDRFRNPVGYAIERSIGPVYDQLAATMDAEALRESLDSIIRIRSVQEFAPSEALEFVFQLKSIIREVLGEGAAELERSGGLAVLDARIDHIALLAFDKYMECQEKLFDIRTDEIRRQSVRVLERYTAAHRAARNGGGAPPTSSDRRTKKGGGGK